MPLKKQSLRSMIQASNAASLDVPAPTLTPEMDLHAPNMEPGNMENYDLADTRVISYGEPHAPKTDWSQAINANWKREPLEAPTQIFTEQDLANAAKPKRVRLTDAQARAQVGAIEKSTPMKERSLRSAAKKTPAFSKTIEQEAQAQAEQILGRKPLAPPETGTMEGQPIAQTVDRRGSNLGREAGERRVASANSVSAKPSAANVGNSDASMLGETRSLKLGMDPSTYLDQGRLAAQYARDTYQPPTEGTVKRSVPVTASERFAGRIAAADTRAASAKAVVATPVVAEVGTAATDLASRLGGALGRRAYGEAGMAVAGATGKGILAAAKGSVQPLLTMGSNIAKRNVATRSTLAALADKGIATRMLKGGWARGAQALGIGAEGLGGAMGMAAKGGGLLADVAAMEFVGRMGKKSTTERNEAVSAFRSQLADYQKQGSKYGFDVTGREGSNAKLQLKALIGADPQIEVKDNPTLRARFEAENKKRIRALIRSGAVHPIAHNRPTISGKTNE